MPSLAILYPGYVDNVKVFRCPSTGDNPQIFTVVDQGGRFVSFGAIGSTATTTAQIIGLVTSSVTTAGKCSYLYDEFTHFRDVGPSQAMASDADGQTWLLGTGQYPTYSTSATTSTGTNTGAWSRLPNKSNHENGQNVMYFDGHVRWADTVYGSDEPKDNMYQSEMGWGADTDAYLWDGVDTRVGTVAP